MYLSRFKLLIALFLFSLMAYAAGADEESIEPLQALSEAIAAPDFELLDSTGNTHTLEDYQGQVLVVNFWATWCPPCIREMPSLQNLRSALHDRGLEVLGINMGEGPDEIAFFNERVKVEFPLLLDEDMVMTTAWEVQNLPTTFIVDRNSMIIYAEVGDKPWDDPVIMAQLEALLAD